MVLGTPLVGAEPARRGATSLGGPQMALRFIFPG